ncbi:hypothetical protein WDU94_007658 [Cyamophila willieti]
MGKPGKRQKGIGREGWETSLRERQKGIGRKGWETSLEREEGIGGGWETSLRERQKVEPQAPRIEYKASAVLPGHNVTVKAGEKASVKCVSRYGNPPAKLKWFLGDEELVAKSNQSNSPEVDNRRTWSAVSIVEIAAEKAMNARMLKCVALHESYPAKSMGVDVRLDITLEPQAPRIEYKASAVLPGHNVTVKAGEKASVKCVSRYGNPPAKLKWFLGDEELVAKSNQSNSPEVDNRRTWSAVSIVEIAAEKAMNARMLKCVALHESYPAKSMGVDVRLDITCK